MKYLRIAAVILMIFASSCMQNDKTRGAKLRLMHWGGQDEIKYISTIISGIRRDKGILVTQETAHPGTPYIEKVISQVDNSTPPDVIFIDSNDFMRFYLEDILLDLTPYIAGDSSVKQENYYPEATGRFTIEEKIFVLPREITPKCLVYYNKSAFDEAGVEYPSDDWNWETFLDTAKKLVKMDAKGRVIQYGFIDEPGTWEPWLYGNGGEIADDPVNPKKCLMDSRPAVKGIEFRHSLIHTHKIMPSPSDIGYSYGSDYSEFFISGKTAMYFSSIKQLPRFREITRFDWDTALFPAGPGGLYGFPGKISGYAVVRQSKNKEAAWELVKRLSGEKGQKMLSSSGIHQPAIIKAAASSAFLDNKNPKNKTVVLRAIKDIRFPPLCEKWDEINVSIISPGLDKVWTDTETADLALRKISSAIERNYFRKKRKMKIRETATPTPSPVTLEPETE